MGYQDRQYNRGGDDGSSSGPVSRLLFAADGFFNWSLRLFRVPRSIPGVHGITVRVHILYFLVLAGKLYAAAKAGYLNPTVFASFTLCSFTLILLHEFGHCVACRLVGGEADRILMWPLGGLASCNPPHRWKPAFITTAGGPAVNLVLMPVLGLALIAADYPASEVVFNPFHPGAAAYFSYTEPSWRAWLWAAHVTNASLFFFNMCLPMYPMDCGRLIQEILWARIGYRRSMAISVRLGFIAAILVGIYGLVYDSSQLVALAIFGGMTCYNEKQHLAAYEERPAWASDDDEGLYARSAQNRADDAPAKPTWAQRRAAKAAEKRAQAEAALNAEVDRILAKIRVEGMGALTSKEKATLDAASHKARGR